MLLGDHKLQFNLRLFFLGVVSKNGEMIMHHSGEFIFESLVSRQILNVLFAVIDLCIGLKIIVIIKQ